MGRVKRNVILFTALALGAGYILYGNEEEKQISADSKHLNQPSTNSSETLELKSPHSRNLLAFTEIEEKEAPLVIATRTKPANGLKYTPDDPEMAEIYRTLRRKGRSSERKGIVKRWKRDLQQKEFMAWNLNLNITSSNDIIESYHQTKGKYLKMAVYVEGNGPTEELNETLQSVGTFSNKLFGRKTTGLKESDVSLGISDITNRKKLLNNPVDESFDQNITEDSQLPKNKEGKFLLDFFGIGGNKENPPTEGSDEAPGISSNALTTDSIEPISEIGETAVMVKSEGMENLDVTNVPAITNFESEDSQSMVTEPVLSLVIFRDFNSTESTLDDSEMLGGSTPKRHVNGVTATDSSKCAECNREIDVDARPDGTKAESTNDSVSFASVPPFFDMTERTISAEEFKEFCISLLSGVQKSPRALDEFSKVEGSGSMDIQDTEVKPIDVTVSSNVNMGTDKPNTQSWFASILHSLGFRRRSHNTKVGHSDSIQEAELSKSTESVKFGGNRTSVSLVKARGIDVNDSINIQFDEDLVSPDDGDILTISDCEHFYRQILTEPHFSKPNLLDILNHPILLNKEFQNNSLSIDEHQSQIEIDLNLFDLDPEPISSEITTATDGVKRQLDFENEIKFETTTETFSSEIPVKQHRLSEQVFVTEKSLIETAEIIPVATSPDVDGKLLEEDLSNVLNMVSENTHRNFEISTTKNSESMFSINEATETSHNEFPSESAFSISEATTTFHNELASENGGRIFNIFAAGSGAGDTQEESRFFPGILNFFGSGDRSLDKDPEMMILIDKQKITTTADVEFLDVIGNEEKIVDVTEPAPNKLAEKHLFMSLNTTTEHNLTNEKFIKVINQGEVPHHKLKSMDNEDEIGPFTDIFIDELDLGSGGDNQNRRFFGFLNRGSGDGRDLSDMSTEPENQECVDCTVESNALLSHVEVLDNEITTPSVYIESYVGTEMSNFDHALEYQTAPEITGDKLKDDTQRDYELSLQVLETKVSTVIPPARADQEIQINSREMTTVSSWSDIGDELNDSYSSSMMDITETSLESISVRDRPRLFDNIFLTGSGEGGLFGDTTGQINLVQEVAPTSPPSSRPLLSRRGGRLNDEPLPVLTESTIEINLAQEFVPVLSSSPPHSRGRGARFNDEPPFLMPTLSSLNFPSLVNFTEENDVFDDNFNHIAQPQSNDSRDRFNEESSFRRSTPRTTIPNPSLDNLPKENDEFNGSFNGISEPQSNDQATRNFPPDLPERVTEINSVLKKQNETSISSFVPTQEFQDGSSKTNRTIRPDYLEPENASVNYTRTSTLSNFNTNMTTESAHSFCNSASECSTELNERCLFDHDVGTCKCGRSFMRHPETRKCEAPIMLRMSMKLSGEYFHQELKNRDSERFKRKRKDSIETMWTLLGHDPKLFASVAMVDILGFEEGSLVIHWEVVVAARGNVSVADLIEQVDTDLKEAFQDEELLKKIPLNLGNAELLTVSNEINPCEKTELNYCSEYAECLQDDAGGFKCRCKEGYLDDSSDTEYPGEVCLATCYQSYCGDNGQCELKRNGDRYCLCSGLYFGTRCEISGIIVIAAFSALNLLIIIVVIIVVCCCKKRRRRSRLYDHNRIRFPPDEEFGRFSAAPPRNPDAVAFDETGPAKISKFVNMSTPMIAMPAIQITSPSIIGSSMSYDYDDSTFDRTPSVTEVNVEFPKPADAKLSNF